jgi:hypothetical protein
MLGGFSFFFSVLRCRLKEASSQFCARQTGVVFYPFAMWLKALRPKGWRRIPSTQVENALPHGGLFSFLPPALLSSCFAAQDFP